MSDGFAHRLLVPGVTRRQHHMVDAQGPTVVEDDRLPLARRVDVDGRGVVTDHLQIGRCMGHESLVEPDQVLTHEPPGQIVGGEDRSLRVDPAFVTAPPVALSGRPIRRARRRREVLGPIGRGIERQLPAGIVEDQVVGLAHGVDAATEWPGSMTWTRTGMSDWRAWATARSRTHRPHDPKPDDGEFGHGRHR